jgi:hypothetical protein
MARLFREHYGVAPGDLVEVIEGGGYLMTVGWDDEFHVGEVRGVITDFTHGQAESFVVNGTDYYADELTLLKRWEDMAIDPEAEEGEKATA